MLDDLSVYLAQAFYRFRGLLDKSLVDAELDGLIRPGMGPVLFALFEKNDCPIKHIVRRTRLSPSTLTGTLSRLQDAGLIEQRSDPKDRRTVLVRLTPLGQSVEPRLREMHEKLLASLRGDMTDEEVALCSGLLQRMVEAIEKSEAEWYARRSAKPSSESPPEERPTA